MYRWVLYQRRCYDRSGVWNRRDAVNVYSYIKYFNLSADVRLFGQEFMGQSYAVDLAEMLIKNQNSDNFCHADTPKEDCFPV